MQRGKPYSNSVAIVQGSGSGKSRMVREESNPVFMLPFTPGPTWKAKVMAFCDVALSILNSVIRFGLPASDDSIRDFLDVAASNVKEGQVRYLNLLTQSFRAAASELESPDWQRQDMYVSFARKWRQHMEMDQNRDRLYERAVKSSQVNLVRLSSL
jgi:hypothetical protein